MEAKGNPRVLRLKLFRRDDEQIPRIVCPARPKESFWDPFNSPDWDGVEPDELCTKRLIREFAHYFSRPPKPGYKVFFKDGDLNLATYQIIGPEGSPYEGVPFHFVVRAGPDYPWKPVRMKFLDSWRLPVRISPCFDRDGKICTSLLDTLSLAVTIVQLAVLVRELLTMSPLLEDPIFGADVPFKESDFFDKIIRHESIWMFISQVEDFLGSYPPADATEERKFMWAEKEIGDSILNQFIEAYPKLAKDCDWEARGPLEGTLYSQQKNAKWYEEFLRGSEERKFRWKELVEKLEELNDKVRAQRVIQAPVKVVFPAKRKLVELEYDHQPGCSYWEYY